MDVRIDSDEFLNEFVFLLGRDQDVLGVVPDFQTFKRQCRTGDDLMRGLYAVNMLDRDVPAKRT